MLEIKSGSAAVATTTEVRRNLKAMFDRAKTTRVYVTNDGELVGGIVSPEMMDILDEALADREMVRIAGERLEEIRSGRQKLINEDEFWSRAGLKD